MEPDPVPISEVFSALISPVARMLFWARKIAFWEVEIVPVVRLPEPEMVKGPLAEALTVPTMLFVELSKVIKSPAVNKELPLTLSAPVCVMPLWEVTFNLPEAVDAARLSALVSLRVTLAPVKPTEPVKLLAPGNEISLAAISETLLATVQTLVEA